MVLMTIRRDQLAAYETVGKRLGKTVKVVAREGEMYETSSRSVAYVAEGQVLILIEPSGTNMPDFYAAVRDELAGG